MRRAFEAIIGISIAANKVEYLRTAGGSIRIFVDTLWREPDGTKHPSNHTAA